MISARDVVLEGQRAAAAKPVMHIESDRGEHETDQSEARSVRKEAKSNRIQSQNA